MPQPSRRGGSAMRSIAPPGIRGPGDCRLRVATPAHPSGRSPRPGTTSLKPPRHPHHNPARPPAQRGRPAVARRGPDGEPETPLRFSIGTRSVGDILDRGLEPLLPQLGISYAINLIVLSPLPILQPALPQAMIVLASAGGPNGNGPPAGPDVMLGSLVGTLVFVSVANVLSYLGNAGTVCAVPQEFLDRTTGVGDSPRPHRRPDRRLDPGGPDSYRVLLPVLHPRHHPRDYAEFPREHSPRTPATQPVG